MQSVLVIGANGEQGRAQISELRSAGYRVRAMVRRFPRSPFPAEVDTVYGDLMQPASLRGPLSGVDMVFLNLPSASFTSPEQVVSGFRHFLSAALETRPARIVFNTSLYVGDQPEGFVAHDNRYAICRSLLDSGLPVTIVSPVIFMENILQAWTLPALIEKQTLCYPHARTLPVSWICLTDVARIMRLLAECEESLGRKYVVGGPRALTGPETASQLSAAWGRKIVFESRPLKDFCRAMSRLFAPQEAAVQQRIERDLMAIYRWYNERDPSPFTVDMEQFLSKYPVALTPVRKWAAGNNVFATSIGGAG